MTNRFQKTLALFIFTIFFCVSTSAQVKTFTTITGFQLPENKSYGLIYCGFELTPIMQFSRNIDNSHLHVNIKWVPSTARNIKGSFEYRYRYKGKVYTDKMIGGDVFQPISVSSARFKVVVQGEAKSVNAVFSDVGGVLRDEGGNMIKFSKDAKIETFAIHIIGLEEIYFSGTDAIHKRINEYEAAIKKKEDDAKKAEADKKAAQEKEALAQKQADEKAKNDKAAEEKAKQEQADASKKPETQNTNSKNSDDDFWSDKKTTNTNTNNSSSSGPATKPVKNNQNKPDLAQGTDGNYYRKDANGNYQKIDYDTYMAEKYKKDQAKQKADEEAKQKENDAIFADFKQKLQKSNDDYWADVEKRNNEAKEFGNKVGSIYSGMNAAKSATADIKDNSTLDGNYASIDQLMEDFNRRMSNVNHLVEDAQKIKQENYNNYVDVMYSGSSSTDQAFNQGYKLLGSAIGQMNAEKAKREAKAELERQRAAMEKKIIAEKVKALTEVRTDLFGKFKPGSVPLSSSKVDSNTLYYFVYSYDPAKTGSDNPYLYISNVFPISRYGDGTWPFQSKINNEISQLTPFTEVMHGYYTSPEKAEAMRKALIDVYKKTGGSVLNISYKAKSKAADKQTNTGDFWESGNNNKKENTPTEKPAVKKDNFWNE